MPADDYTAAVSGGLKLKNVSSSSKVSKSHKKKRPKSSQPADAGNSNDGGAKDDGGDVKIDQDDSTIGKNEQVLDDVEAASPSRAGKTEAELRHEERRRKRVCYLHVSCKPGHLPKALPNQNASARRAPEARRHQDAQRARGRTEPLS